MPAWIHDRAEHIRRSNPSMPVGQSFAIATQQAHATGKAPKNYGTSEGKKAAKGKYNKPKSEYVQTADPSSKTKSSSIDLALLKGFSIELMKIAGFPRPKKLEYSQPKMMQPAEKPTPTPDALPPPLASAAG